MSTLSFKYNLFNNNNIIIIINIIFVLVVIVVVVGFLVTSWLHIIQVCKKHGSCLQYG